MDLIFKISGAGGSMAGTLALLMPAGTWPKATLSEAGSVFTGWLTARLSLFLWLTAAR